MLKSILLLLWLAGGPLETQEKAPKEESSSGKALRVEVQKTPLRAKPLHFAPPIDELKEGDVVAEISASGAWVKVKTSKGQEGWLPATTVAKRDKVKFRIGAPTSDQDVENADSYNAGRFDPETEKEYKKEKDMGRYFDQVDWIQSHPGVKSDSQQLDARLRDFRKNGKIGEFMP